MEIRSKFKVGDQVRVFLYEGIYEICGVTLIPSNNEYKYDLERYSVDCEHESFGNYSEEKLTLYKAKEPEEAEKQMKRDNKDKLDWSQIPFKLLNGLVRVLMYGAKKYTKRNWAKGAPVSEIYNSLQRHINSFMEGEDNDKESGLSHLGHAQANLMFLVHVIDNKKQFDDRSKDKSPSKVTRGYYNDTGDTVYVNLSELDNIDEKYFKKEGLAPKIKGNKFNKFDIVTVKPFVDPFVITWVSESLGSYIYDLTSCESGAHTTIDDEIERNLTLYKKKGLAPKGGVCKYVDPKDKCDSICDHCKPKFYCQRVFGGYCICSNQCDECKEFGPKEM